MLRSQLRPICVLVFSVLIAFSFATTMPSLSEDDARAVVTRYLSASSSANVVEISSCFNAETEDEKATIQAFAALKSEERRLVLVVAEAFPGTATELGPDFLPEADDTISALREASTSLVIRTSGSGTRIVLGKNGPVAALPVVYDGNRWLIDLHAFLHVRDESSESLRALSGQFAEQTAIVTSAIDNIKDHRFSTVRAAMVEVEGKLIAVEVRHMKSATSRMSSTTQKSSNATTIFSSDNH